MRTLGVEEELLLVDERSGRPVPIAQQVLGAMPTWRLTAEMHQEMIETITRPTTSADALADDVGRGRPMADERARRLGARAVALPVSPLPAVPHPTPSRRYAAMTGAYGALPKRSLSCGLHVHVGVESPDEGVGVLDRIRPWLPALVALSANSPFADGEDTGHASWRTVAWSRWPSAAIPEVFGGLAAYREHDRRLLAAAVLLDAGML